LKQSRALLGKRDGPQAAVNIAAMFGEQAMEVMRQICALSEAVADALGRQSNSEYDRLDYLTL
jgi:hypothetical protein